jgi:serine phosphatase RsbU (regulator of sigma subunit)
VDYAVQNLENVILDDAMNSSTFGSNPYVRKNMCRSVLCSPMVYQGRVLGMLYLENRSISGAFSADNLEFLKMLSSTAAVSIQNARIYGELEQRVAERTEEVMAQKDEIERQRDEIQLKNEDILASIRYARRIQMAILPSPQDILATFPQSFLLYKPRDVVSGDFYWFSKRLSKTILAAADCTGHGVPGAFMTIMANTLLKQIVELEGIFEPSEILAQLHLRIRVALKQGNELAEVEQTNDGLDIALCQVDVKRMRMVYAGANRSLLLIRKGEAITYKPDRYGIGGDMFKDEARTYADHHIDLEPGDTIYIFSDGYIDQVGGNSDKRYSSKRLTDFLLAHQDKDMEHQKLLLEAELYHWMGNEEQMDDIVMLGVRF